MWFVSDFLKINEAIFPDKYPLPLLEEVMTEFCGYTIFSS